MNYTSIEQSKKLLELGLSPESADMCYKGSQSIIDPKEREYTKEPFVRGKYTSFDNLRIFYPCWSVGALLEVMPPVIKGDRLDGFSLCCWKTSLSYIVQYEKTIGNVYEKEIDFSGDTPIEAYYKMVVWLLENNYIKND